MLVSNLTSVGMVDIVTLIAALERWKSEDIEGESVHNLDNRMRVETMRSLDW